MRNNKGQFIKGHNKGTKFSLEHIDKLKKSHKGFFGHKHTKETKKKIGKKSKGRTYWNKGKQLPDWIKKKISEGQKGKKHTAEHRKHLSEALKGRKFSEEHKNNISKNHHNVSLENNPRWCGGKSFEPYTIDWTETLRTSIRERDKFTCKLCGIKQGDRLLDIHHIDYNKENCNPNNLISLCMGCHRKTNNKRDYWTNYFLCK